MSGSRGRSLRQRQRETAAGVDKRWTDFFHIKKKGVEQWKRTEERGRDGPAFMCSLIALEITLFIFFFKLIGKLLISPSFLSHCLSASHTALLSLLPCAHEGGRPVLSKGYEYLSPATLLYFYYAEPFKVTSTDSILLWHLDQSSDSHFFPHHFDHPAPPVAARVIWWYENLRSLQPIGTDVFMFASVIMCTSPRGALACLLGSVRA